MNSTNPITAFQFRLRNDGEVKNKGEDMCCCRKMKSKTKSRFARLATWVIYPLEHSVI